jgi:hypothetical protein
MIKDRQELEGYLEKEIIKITTDNDICKEIFSYVNSTYEIPKSMVSDYIAMRTSLAEASEFILFCLLDGIEKITKKKKSTIDAFFTMQETKTYRISKYKDPKLKFPLRFKVIQINDDQWTGKIDIKTLMKMREAQIINYNINAQRTLQKIVKGEKEIYKISINPASVNAIKKLFENNIYIPTPFTLNIPVDTDYDFYYDEDNCELVIKSLDHFDLTDGYHRYIAGCNLSDIDKTFNYTMELRIVNFTEDKAKQFIYQEDQKTKMRKVDSESMNMNKAANIVVNRLNESPQCNLQGSISRNKGIINFGYLADLVNYFYFKGGIKKNEKAVILTAVKELTNNFNKLTEYNSVYLEKPYSYKQICAIMYVFDYFRDKEEDFCDIIDEIVARAEKLNSKKFYNKTPKKAIMNEIESIIEQITKEKKDENDR